MTRDIAVHEPWIDWDTLRRWVPTGLVFLLVGFLGALPRVLRDYDRSAHWIKYFGIGTGCLMASSCGMLIANALPWLHGQIDLIIVAGWLCGYAGLPLVDRIIRRLEVAIDRYITRIERHLP